MKIIEYQIEELSLSEMKEINGGFGLFAGLLILAGIAFIAALISELGNCNCDDAV